MRTAMTTGITSMHTRSCQSANTVINIDMSPDGTRILTFPTHITSIGTEAVQGPTNLQFVVAQVPVPRGSGDFLGDWNPPKLPAVGDC